MGRTGKKPSAGIAATLAATLLLLAMACGGGSPDISELLLAPGDLSGRQVTQISLQTGETAEEQPTAITELAASDFTVLHSLVIFETQNSARAALAGVKLQWEQLARDNDGTTLSNDDLAPLAIASGELVAGVLEELRAGNQTSSLIFVQGRVLVRLTISGTSGMELLLSLR